MTYSAISGDPAHYDSWLPGGVNIHAYLNMYQYKIIMYTCILNFVYMQDNCDHALDDYVYMQDNYVSMQDIY